MIMNQKNIPAEGLQGLRQNWKADALSGFLVFLLALPLSLGIAKASEFPPAMGVLTAMIGGLIVTFFAGSRLTIKGPAAGLITISAGAVMEMGGGEAGWHFALAAILMAAVIQVLFGFLKFGSLSDFFPHSVVHGMLAAIGLIIFSKQVHVLLGIDPALLKGLEPLELYARIPESIMHADPRVTLLGVISLVIIFGLPFVRIAILRRIPAPMWVLLVTIPMALLMDFKHTEPAFDMVKIGDFWGSIGWNPDFGMVGEFVFWKYVLMFLFVNSLETLLTVKAIDGLDPWRRISDPNKDLVAVGIGNAASASLGGLPMISEVARSSANVSFGGRTRWANFFHGLFLLVAMALFIPVIEMIPNTALAALLIAVGYRLASPREFFKVYRIGPEQLVIFVTTIIVTLATDLLLGVAAGVLLKFVFHLMNGVPVGSLFRAHVERVDDQDKIVVHIRKAAVFSNIMEFKRVFESVPKGRVVILDFSEAVMLDHMFMEVLHHFQEEYEHAGGEVVIRGFDRFKSSSDHPLSARKYSEEALSRMEIRLTPRQVLLREFASSNDFMFHPQQVRNVLKFTAFPVAARNRIHFEESILSRYHQWGKVEVSDVSISVGGQEDVVVTVMELTELEAAVPDFTLEPENLWSRISEMTFGKDIDFTDHPGFSSKYYLRAGDEQAIRKFFRPDLLEFLTRREEMHVECGRNRLLLYKRMDVVSPAEILQMLDFASELVSLVQEVKAQS